MIQIFINNKLILSFTKTLRIDKLKELLDIYKSHNIVLPIFRTQISYRHKNDISTMLLVDTDGNCIEDLSKKKIGFFALREEILHHLSTEEKKANKYLAVKDVEDDAIYFEFLNPNIFIKEDIKNNKIIKAKSKIGSYLKEIVDNNQNVLVSVDAATGSGKTYAVKETIIHIDRNLKNNIAWFTAPTKSNLNDLKDEKEYFNNHNIPILRNYAEKDLQSLKTWEQLYSNLTFILERFKEYKIESMVLKDKFDFVLFKISELFKEFAILETADKKKREVIENIIQQNANYIKLFIVDITGDWKFKRKYNKEFDKIYQKDKHLFLDVVEFIGSLSSIYDILNFKQINTIFIYSTFSKLIAESGVTIVDLKRNTKGEPVDEKDYIGLNRSNYVLRKVNFFSSFDTTNRNNLKSSNKALLSFYQEKEANIFLFMDESTESIFYYKNQLKKDRKLGLNLPQFLGQYYKELIFGISLDFWEKYNYYRKLKNGIGKIFNQIIETEIELQEMENNALTSNENIQKLREFYDKINFLNVPDIEKEKFKTFLGFHCKKKSRETFIYWINEYNMTLIEKLFGHFKTLKTNISKFNISMEKFFKILSFSAIDSNLKIDRKLYNQEIQQFQEIFLNTSGELYVNHKEFLEKFIIEFNENTEIILKEIDKKYKEDEYITLYEYLMSVLIVIYMLNEKNLKTHLKIIENELNDKTEKILLPVREKAKSSNYNFVLDNISNTLNDKEFSIKIDEEFVFEKDKFLITLTRYEGNKKKINCQKVELNFGFAFLNKTPEYFIQNLIHKFNGGKIAIFKLSATDGNFDSIIDWDDGYLKRKLVDKYIINDDKLNAIIQEINNVRNKEIKYTQIIGLNDIIEYNKMTNTNLAEYFPKLENLVIKSFNEYLNRVHKYKEDELAKIIRIIATTINNNEIRANLIVTQTIKYFKEIIESYYFNAKNEGLWFLKVHKNISNIDRFNGGVYLLMQDDTPIAKIVLYKNEIENYIDSYNNSQTIKEYYNEKHFNDIVQKYESWENILRYDEKENLKLIIIGDYKNVSIGLNFTQKIIIKDNKEYEYDFDALTVLTDPIYDFSNSNLVEAYQIFDFKLRMFINYQKQFPNIDLRNLHTIIFHPAFLYHKKIQDFWYYFNLFIQFFGRGTRKDINKYLYVFLNKTTIQKLQIIQKVLKEFSINNSVFSKISNPTLSILDKIANFKVQIFKTEIDKQLFFRMQDKSNKIYISFVYLFLQQMLTNFRNNNIKDKQTEEELLLLWDNYLRDVNTFIKDKRTYFKNLTGFLSDSIIFNKFQKFYFELEDEEITIDDIITSLCLYDDRKEESVIKHNNITLLNKIEYVEENTYCIDDNNIKALKYVDIETKINNANSYNIAGNNNIFNEFSVFRAGSLIYNKDINNNYTLFKDLKTLNRTKNKDIFLVNPNLYKDILGAAFLEKLLLTKIKETVRYIFGKNIKIFDLDDYLEHKFLYEKFDIYVEIDSTLYCFDAKNWGRNADFKLSDNTITKTKRKVEEIKNNGTWDNIVPIFVNLISSINVSIVDEINVFSLYTKIAERIQENQINFFENINSF